MPFYIVHNILVHMETTATLDRTTDPHDFVLDLATGKSLDLTSLKGKPLLIVNTATKCGLAPQFEGLEEIHQKYGPRGLTVIGFPSNQFANQEPESDASVTEVCRIHHGVTFPLTKKVEVNGTDTHPLFALLKSRAPGFLGIPDVKWNFTKFLISGDGTTVTRYSPTTPPETLHKDIEKQL